MTCKDCINYNEDFKLYPPYVIYDRVSGGIIDIAITADYGCDITMTCKDCIHLQQNTCEHYHIEVDADAYRICADMVSKDDE